jgi:putative ABC transport system permease protein
MKIQLLRGRDIAETDTGSAPGVVVINEKAARSYWPGEDPISKRISFDAGTSEMPTWLTVIGIVKDAKQGDWAAKPDEEVYLAAFQNRQFLGAPESHSSYITLVARTTGDPAALTQALKDTVWSFDRNLPISQVLTMDAVVADANAQPRFEMLLLGMLAAVALLLAAVGIYGVMSYAVSRRSHEIGIRVSLGASRADIVLLVIRHGMVLALIGSAAGIVGALGLSRLMKSLLYGVKPIDPLIFGGVTILLMIVAMAASYLPARRAMRVDPTIALRYE